MSFIHRIPSSETVGLKDDYNGPICYTPDGNPLLGPALACATCGWPKASPSASPPRAAPATTSRR
jgi:glycine/D-amino acid oxidase-like deaminating enzyme